MNVEFLKDYNMRKILFKRQILVYMLLLFSMGVRADDELITQQLTIENSEPGTLSSKISLEQKNKITNLKLTGKLNGSDIRFIREMAGSDAGGFETDGQLAVLDMEDASIVKGGDNYFYTETFTTYYTEDGIIGQYMFMSCNKLVTIKLPKSVTKIGFSSFRDCQKLKNVSIPYSVKWVDDAAFYNCCELSDVNIPSSVTYLGSSVFCNCVSLSRISIPSSITYIEGGSFSGCTGLIDLDLPKDLKEIKAGAFVGCSSLSNITIPSSVTTIERVAFRGCTGLISLNLQNGLTTIGDHAFEDCTSLEFLSIPSTVSYLGFMSFYKCQGLRTLRIASKIEYFGSESFEGCSGLESVYVSTEEPIYIVHDTFEGIDRQKCTLYVPNNCLDQYKASVWGQCFDNIIEYDVTGINHVKTSSEVTPVARYSINGSKLESPVKGLNIVRYSDGSIRKEIQK